jgi:succinyl-CoA synthetase alpha subunit
MGHAGAWAAPGEPDAQTKYQALERAGAVMVNHPEKFGEGMKSLLGNRVTRPGTSVSSNSKHLPLALADIMQPISGAGSQKRGFHTIRRVTPISRPAVQQKRSLHIKQFQALEILKQKSIAVNETASSSDGSVSISVDRTALSPCIVASPGTEFEPAQSRRFPFSYDLAHFGNDSVIPEVASHLGLPASAQDNLASLVQALWEIFKEKEAFVLETRLGLSTEGNLEVHGAHFGFDDAAYRSSERQEEIHSLRNKAEEVPEEVEAEKDGIVYITYDHTTHGI